MSNYPAGARNDPRAPFNQPDPGYHWEECDDCEGKGRFSVCQDCGDSVCWSSLPWRCSDHPTAEHEDAKCFNCGGTGGNEVQCPDDHCPDHCDCQWCNFYD